MNEEKVLKFPENFLWGTSSSAYQIEGGITNDWSEWENNNAQLLAQKAKSYWQDWQQEKFPEMFEPENYICGRACDSYELFGQDLECLKELNVNTYRFGIEWARVEPEEGKFDKDAINHYINIIRQLQENKIEPLVTIYHWTVPLWLRNQGSWKAKKAVEYFCRYTRKIVKELNNEVKFWITINEPLIFSSALYIKGRRLLKKRDLLSYYRIVNNLIQAHKICFGIIKKINPSAQVGIAKNIIYFDVYKNCPVSLLLKKGADWWWNSYFLNKIKDHQDFIGLNYYHRNRIKGAKFNQNENKEVSDLGWEIYPKGIYYVLKKLQKYRKPIYITENGLADNDDDQRKKFITDHLKYVNQAIEEGVDVRGYFHWSLLDNFEWDKGFWPKFGLYEVDRKTFKRTARPSAKVYADICKNNFIKI